MSTLTRHTATLLVAAFSFACSDDSNDGGSAAGSGGSGAGANQVTFADDIHPILLAKCGASGCHDGGQEPTLPGHGAADVEHAYEATQSTSYTGEPVYERILTRISTSDAGFMMPPTFATPPCQGTIGSPGCITQSELELIRAWIDAGTPP